MRQKAVDAAYERLAQAKDAVDELNSTQLLTRKMARDAWWRFILASNGVYSKLEQGAKNSGKSTAWYGRKKHERKQDDLLNYLHHARNCDEHCIDGSLEHTELGIDVTGPFVKKKIGPDGKEKITILAGSPVVAKAIFPGLHLLEVVDTRFNERFPPPAEHLGKPAPADPREVAALMIAYLEGLISDASEYICD